MSTEIKKISIIQAFKIAMKDVFNTLALLNAALFFTWSDTKARYRRSAIGPFWLVFGTAVGVGGLGFVWSSLLNVDKATFIPSLTVGLIIWQFISGCVVEGASSLTRNTALVRNLKLPFLFFPLQTILRQLINFAHSLIIIVVVFIIYPPNINSAQWLIIPGLLLVIANMLWIAALIGFLGARLRDIEPSIGAVMPLLFFISPVLFKPEQVSFSSAVIWFNPFTYLIAVVRDPLTGTIPTWDIYQVNFGMLLVGWFITLLFMGKKHHRIAFWV